MHVEVVGGVNDATSDAEIPNMVAAIAGSEEKGRRLRCAIMFVGVSSFGLFFLVVHGIGNSFATQAQFEHYRPPTSRLVVRIYCYFPGTVLSPLLFPNIFPPRLECGGRTGSAAIAKWQHLAAGSTPNKGSVNIRDVHGESLALKYLFKLLIP